MTDKEKAHILTLVDRLMYSRDHAHNAYQRYTLHPDTMTGKKDLVRFEKWDVVFEETRDELYDLLMKKTVPTGPTAKERGKMRAVNAGLRDMLEDLVHQFAYEMDDPPRLGTGGLSALEHAFATLGWEDPHPVPERKCDEPKCRKMRKCGWPDKDGKYRWTCHKHTPKLNGGYHG